MPKVTDEPSKEEEKEESRETRVVEGQSEAAGDLHTPSPQRRPLQSSPPKFVSVEELMETAKGVTNMALAHEIVVNRAFQVKLSEPAEGSLEKRVKDIMHKAFWDSLEAQLNEDPPSYDHSIILVGEIKETLLSFLLPSQGRLQKQIEEALDLSLIQQQAGNGALDIRRIAQFIIGMMEALCAPCRDEDVRKLHDISETVPLLKAVFSVLDEMKIDMANFAVSSIRPHLLEQSVQYERKTFQEFLAKQPNALDFTEKWLQDTAVALRSGEIGPSVGAESGSSPLLTVHNHAYLRLLKWDHNSVPFPETLLMDQLRFQEMQLDLERLSVVASVLLIVYNCAGEAIAGLPGLMERLKKTIVVLLSEMHMSSFNADEAFATISEKLCCMLGECLSEHAFLPFTTERQSALKGQIVAVRSPDNTIRKLIDSRIQTYLLTVLERTPHRSPIAVPGGLAPIGKELDDVSVRFGHLVNFNKQVYYPFYQRILQNILKDDTVMTSV
ncbi:T-complex protein 11-like protein 1 isoform X2 [Denticeps clupeoides]|uniref:T-complex protein 11-like protein 1 n=2 Tax=Denticeps clupeoides TaxID=299321 RepID=A0AAY4CAB9_9TELE|nr:T-complex protein 11-like protein 1 isoform X2 [Denticeps clupeoides]